MTPFPILNPKSLDLGIELPDDLPDFSQMALLKGLLPQLLAKVLGKRIQNCLDLEEGFGLGGDPFGETFSLDFQATKGLEEELPVLVKLHEATPGRVDLFSSRVERGDHPLEL